MVSVGQRPTTPPNYAAQLARGDTAMWSVWEVLIFLLVGAALAWILHLILSEQQR